MFLTLDGTVSSQQQPASAVMPDEAVSGSDPERISAADLRRVLRDPEQPRLVFQPIVDLHRGSVAGYECLARFDGPPAATPDRWFAAAELAGVGAELEARVVGKALQLRPFLPESRFLAINVSPHLLPSPEVRAAFAAGGDLVGVVVELTEHLPMGDSGVLGEALAAVRDARASIALDDAGSGYAGLSQLLAVRPQLVKLDRALVDRIHEDPIKLALTELLGNVAGRMDSWLLAEGIERDEELETLVGLGVPLGQGWLLGRPASSFQELHPDLATRIRLLAHRRDRRDSIGGLIQLGLPLIDDDGAPAGTARWTVSVDVDECPTALNHPLLAQAGHPITLRISARADAETVLLRALGREPAHRFDPLVVVDETGRYLGLVTMERLISHATSLRSSSRSSEVTGVPAGAR